ncbi:2-hydroxyacid dehydrogenase [Paracoccus tegillarcae]|uniref:Hydroxyacid dehydrogenase n=1 Tax=Paracoccus tegillarcae TaxID=1529068 RepID=A0A2K9EPD0_9RHOB|nr:2-hydroxyacid dehydrogenase [Paracoccus tegillarcae]AUH33515.1 hydroxyacid dehydrogenase [Paracoccus tegillarcae]
MTDTLAIGGYTGADAQALEQDFSAKIVSGLDALDELSPEAREQVRGVAYQGHAPFDGEQMDKLPNLKVIANFGVGYDAIDVAAASQRGITVTNTPNVLNDDVADLAVGMLIAQVRDFEAGAKAVRSGDWAAKGALPLARKMSGRKIGVLGMGRIGREIADRLAAFKTEIHYQSRSQKDTPGWTYHADPVDLARAVDDIVIAIVGGPETEGFVSAEVLAALGSDGVVVNIARGSVIDEEALIEALSDGTIRAAALDVFRGEPKVDPRLSKLDNMFPLPHIGSATVETRAAMGALQRQNLRAGLDGQTPPTPVN